MNAVEETNKEVLIVAILITVLVRAGMTKEDAQKIAEYRYLDCLMYDLPNSIPDLRRYKYIGNIICSVFVWEHTPEGQAYWRKLAREFEDTPSCLSEYLTEYEDAT